MKKFFSLLALMLLCSIGAMAQVIPVISTDEAPVYYVIASYDRGGFLTSNGAGNGVTHVAQSVGSIWYFTAAQGNESNNVANGVIAHCLDGTQLTTDWKTADNGGVVYIKGNGVNENGLVICKNSTTLSSNCADASNASNGVGTWGPVAGDWKGTTWVFQTLFPLASDDVFVNLNNIIKNANDKSAGLVQAYQKYNEGISSKYFFIKSAYPNYLTKQSVEKAFIANANKITWGDFDAGNPYEYFQISVTDNGNYNIKPYKVDKFMTATNGTLSATATNNTVLRIIADNQFNITVGTGSPCHTEGHLEGAGKNGNIVAWAGDANSCSAWSIVETTEAAYNAANTKTIQYTITDAVGNQYEGTYTGGKGDMPPFAGVIGQTYNNVVWNTEGDNLTLTANIVFPFPVSKAGTDNWTYIGSFQSENCLWFAKDNKLKMQINIKPTNAENSNESYEWAIYPTFTEGKFTFKIKNALGGYLAGTNTSLGDEFVLNDEGRSYTFAAHLTNKRGFFDEEKGRLITFNSSRANDEQNGWLWEAGDSHNGSNLNFYTPADFNILIEKLSGRGNLLGEGLGHYSANNAENEAKVRGVIGGTQYATAAELTTLFNALSLNMPADGTFVRLYNSGRKIQWGDTSYLNATGTTETFDKNCIFYYKDGKLLNYGNGYYQKNATVSDVIDDATTWTIVEGKTAATNSAYGSYALSNGTAYLCTWGRKANDNFMLNSNDNWETWVIEEVTELPLTIASSGYSTFNCPVQMKVAEGVNAYTAAVDVVDPANPTITYKKLEGGVIPANTAVLLSGEGETTLTVDNSEIAESITSDLEGTVAAKAISQTTDTQAEKYYYVLSNGTFKYSTGTKINGFKGYLHINLPYAAAASSNFRVIFEEGGVTTGIESIEKVFENAGIYDLQGRRINNARKGMFIVNGKKVIR